MKKATAQVINPQTGYLVSVKRGDVIRPCGYGNNSKDLAVECVRGEVIYTRCVARGIMYPVFGKQAAEFRLVV